ncbi:class I SAM-dependent methyltransferase [Streptomyces sp. NPDC005438]|uniref:SAM-dependent methyltransferase n=1 Tax=Streptomyces sp. NPDC005438 TaxID=3156880 RepID=UPI0033A2CCCB
MERERVSALWHRNHPIAGPLDDSTVTTLLDRSLPKGPARLLDLGCKEGEWLRRALRRHPETTAVGVDIDGEAVRRGRDRGDTEGLADRLELLDQDARAYADSAGTRFDVVLSVGAAHAFGGLAPTLRAVEGLLAEGGTALVGDGFWERPPGPATLDAGFEAEEYQDLAGTVRAVREAGWVPVYGHVSTPGEWDAYEWNCVGTLSAWALDHPRDPDSREALTFADRHREAWLSGYRGTLGFVTLVLRGGPAPAP